MTHFLIPQFRESGQETVHFIRNDKKNRLRAGLQTNALSNLSL